jgi:hypothetical protein
MSTGSFEIEVTSQGWLGEPSADWEPAHDDLCSHGDIRLVISGRVIAPGEGSGDYAIGTSALALLRTLESDHSPGLRVVPTALVMHCGGLLMVSCPYGIDWAVLHRGRRVLISDVVKDECEKLDGLSADLSEDEYRRQIIAFATTAKELFAASEKSLDDSTRAEFEEFWREYDERLERARAEAEEFPP